MSVKIGELSDSLISFYPVFILSNNKNWVTEVSDTNKLFAILKITKPYHTALMKIASQSRSNSLTNLFHSSKLTKSHLRFKPKSHHLTAMTLSSILILVINKIFSSLRRTAGRFIFFSAYMVTNLHPSKSNMKKARFGGSCMNQTPKELF
jgi:hypothetical protein